MTEPNERLIEELRGDANEYAHRPYLCKRIAAALAEIDELRKKVSVVMAVGAEQAREIAALNRENSHMMGCCARLNDCQAEINKLKEHRNKFGDELLLQAATIAEQAGEIERLRKFMNWCAGTGCSFSNSKPS